MSSRELYEHRTLLERDPVLLPEVERLDGPAIGEKRIDPDAEHLENRS
jgi:hypothetical protein